MELFVEHVILRSNESFYILTNEHSPSSFLVSAQTQLRCQKMKYTIHLRNRKQEWEKIRQNKKWFKIKRFKISYKVFKFRKNEEKFKLKLHPGY